MALIMQMQKVDMKTCSTCRILKSYSDFSRCKNRSDGLQNNCKDCAKKYNINLLEKDIDYFKKAFAKQLQKDPDYFKKANAKKLEKDPDYFKKVNAKYRKTTKGRITKLKSSVKRVDAIKIATPLWLTDLQRIEIYEFFRNCPKGYTVDHIVPIQGKEVSGLNVIWNLQYLTKEENLKKGNRFTPQWESDKCIT